MRNPPWEKLDRVQIGSPLEVEMRQSMVTLIMTYGNEPLVHTVETIRKVLIACIDALKRTESDRHTSPATRGNAHQSMRVFGSADDWLEYYFMFFEVEAIRLYVGELFDKIARADERKKSKRNGAPLALDCEALKENIPFQMQIRMRSEVHEYFNAFAGLTLISEDSLRRVISANMDGLRGLLEEEGCALKEFTADPALRLDHGSFKEWLAYYLQGYSIGAITKILLDLQATHLGANLRRFIRESVELKAEDWEKVVRLFPQVRNKRDEFHEVLCGVVMDSIVDMRKYVYSAPRKRGVSVRLEPEHISGIRMKCTFDADAKIAYAMRFSCDHNGVTSEDTCEDAVFIRRIISNMNMAPSLATAEGLVVRGSIGEA